MKNLKIIFTFIVILTTSISNAQYVNVDKVEIIPSNPTDEDSVKIAVEVLIASNNIHYRDFFQTGTEVRYEFCYSASNNTGGGLIKDTFLLNQIQSGAYTYKIVIYESLGGISCTPVDSTITIDSFYVASAVSLPKHQLLQKLKIYPNPTKDYLNITTLDKLEINGIEIRDIQGKLVKTKNPAGASQDKRSINISKLPPGTYVLMLKTNKGNASKQFIVE